MGVPAAQIDPLDVRIRIRRSAIGQSCQSTFPATKSILPCSIVALALQYNTYFAQLQI